MDSQRLVSHREWLIERKSEAEEEDRKRKAELERKRREHQARVERERVEHLLSQACALEQAVQIRAYVRAVQEANQAALHAMTEEEMIEWSRWALEQADRVDPIVSGHYRVRPKEENFSSD